MINDKRVLGIIPARGGSKGLPGKNIRMLCGKPLIVWSIERGLSSEYIDELLVSTDSENIAEISAMAGANVPFIRPDELATDTATTFSVVEHALKFCRQKLSQEFDYVVLLEPTSPLREKEDVDNMLENLEENSDKFDSIISIGEVAEHPSIMKKKSNGYLKPFCPDVEQTYRRQDNHPAYFPYGVAYIAKTNQYLKEQTFYTERSSYYEIKRYQNYEIDDVYDFYCIERVMEHEWSL